MNENCIFGAVLIIAALVSMPVVFPRPSARRDAEKYLRSVQVDLGQVPEDPRDRAAREQEERENYNRFAGAVQAADDNSSSVYVDYDGWLREAGSDTPIQWVGNRATGATKRPN